MNYRAISLAVLAIVVFGLGIRWVTRVEPSPEILVPKADPSVADSSSASPAPSPAPAPRPATYPRRNVNRLPLDPETQKAREEGYESVPETGPALEERLRQKPTDEQALAKFVDTSAKAGQHDAALRTLEELFESNPNTATLADAMADILHS